MNAEGSSILAVSSLVAKSVQEVIKNFCRFDVIVGKNAQFLSTIQISEDIGAFVSFNGNYSGLMVMNFEGEAALEIVRTSMLAMGMPQSEIPTHYTADDVRSSIGEFVNHIIGHTRAKIQETYDLSASATIPAVLPIATPIGLFFKSSITDGHDCIRLVFRTPGNHRFHVELTMESSRFVELPL